LQRKQPSAPVFPFLGIAAKETVQLFSCKLTLKQSNLIYAISIGEVRRRFALRNDLIIHVIDDDSLIRDSLNCLLKSEGYTVRAYVSARSFLDMIEPTGNGCIITDIHMPEMNGLDLLATLNERGIFMPAIAMSGRYDVELEIEAKKRGAVDFFEKPFDPEILLEAVGAATKNNAYRAAEAAWREAQTAAATLRADCERRIELAERADVLRAELAEIEAQAAMHEATVNGVRLPVGLFSAGLGSAAEERARWADIRARLDGVTREAFQSEVR
jgi:two-component system response regulator FixJ